MPALLNVFCKKTPVISSKQYIWGVFSLATKTKMDLRLQGLKIRSKIILPMLAVLILLTVAFLSNIYDLRNKKRDLLKNIDSIQNAIANTNSLTNLENLTDADTLTYRFDRSAALLEEIKKANAEKAVIYNKMLANASTENDMKLLQAYFNSLAATNQIRLALEQATVNAQEQAIEKAFGDWKEKDKLTDSSLSELFVYNTGLLNTSKNLYNEIIRQIEATNLAVLCVAAFLVLLLYFYLDFIIARPLAHLTQETEKIMERDIEWDSKMNARDEIGILGSKLKEMSLSLKDYYSRLQKMAFFDTLSNLPNRQSLDNALKKMLDEANQNCKMVGVIMLDLDRFKNINDTFGHNEGDKVLMEVARRLKQHCVAGEFIARLGGDEFVILLPGIKNAQEAEDKAKLFIRQFERPVKINSHMFYITTSVGVSVYPIDGLDEPALLKNADIALYAVKNDNRNNYQMYSAMKDQFASRRPLLENGLKEALDKKQITLYYQPIIDLRRNVISSTEVLMRWYHPELGMVLPQNFVPIAEETGDIVPIGEWIIRQVCVQETYWLKKGLPQIKLAINLSARQFLDPYLVRNLKTKLEEFNLDPKLFDLEITESVAMVNIEQAAAKLKELSRMGFGIVIDDFGTGYSSLSYIKKLPVKKIKIDKSFIRDLLVDEQDAAIVRAIISMARSLNLKVIAEGVESEAQLEFLRSLGCDEIQGHLVSQPLNDQAFAYWYLVRHGKNINLFQNFQDLPQTTSMEIVKQEQV